MVTIVGAGRGPLVDCTLRALLHSGRQASIYAVEKNTNAFVTLQERKELEWRDKVHIISGDMRVIDVPEKCDILVSELLGSFGDNELSPECLDGALRLMNCKSRLASSVRQELMSLVHSDWCLHPILLHGPHRTSFDIKIISRNTFSFSRPFIC